MIPEIVESFKMNSKQNPENNFFLYFHDVKTSPNREERITP